MARTLKPDPDAFPTTDMLFEAPTKQQHFDWYTRSMLPALVTYFFACGKYPSLGVMLSPNWRDDEKVAAIINRCVLQLFTTSDAKHRNSYANEMVVFTRNLSIMYSGYRLSDEEPPVIWNSYSYNKGETFPVTYIWQFVEKTIRNAWINAEDYNGAFIKVNLPAYSTVDGVNIKGGHTSIWDVMTGKKVSIQDKERIISYVYTVWYRTEDITLQGIAVGILKYLDDRYGLDKRAYALHDTLTYIKELLAKRYHLKLAIDSITIQNILKQYSHNIIEADLWSSITDTGFVQINNPIILANNYKERTNNAFFNEIGKTQQLNNVLYINFDDLRNVFFDTGEHRFAQLPKHQVVLAGNGLEYVALHASSGRTVAGHETKKRPTGNTKSLKSDTRALLRPPTRGSQVEKFSARFRNSPLLKVEKVEAEASQPTTLKGLGSFHLGAVMSTDDLPPETQKLLESYIEERKTPALDEPIKEQIGLELVPTKEPVYVKTDGERGELVKRTNPIIIRASSSRWTLRKNEDNTYNLYVYVWGLASGWKRVSTIEDSALEALLIKVLEN